VNIKILGRSQSYNKVTIQQA